MSVSPKKDDDKDVMDKSQMQKPRRKSIMSKKKSGDDDVEKSMMKSVMKSRIKGGRRKSTDEGNVEKSMFEKSMIKGKRKSEDFDKSMMQGGRKSKGALDGTIARQPGRSASDTAVTSSSKKVCCCNDCCGECCVSASRLSKRAKRKADGDNEDLGVPGRTASASTLGRSSSRTSVTSRTSSDTLVDRPPMGVLRAQNRDDSVLCVASPTTIELDGQDAAVNITTKVPISALLRKASSLTSLWSAQPPSTWSSHEMPNIWMPPAPGNMIYPAVPGTPMMSPPPPMYPPVPGPMMMTSAPPPQPAYSLGPQQIMMGAPPPTDTPILRQARLPTDVMSQAPANAMIPGYAPLYLQPPASSSEILPVKKAQSEEPIGSESDFTLNIRVVYKKSTGSETSHTSIVHTRVNPNEAGNLKEYVKRAFQQMPGKCVSDTAAVASKPPAEQPRKKEPAVERDQKAEQNQKELKREKPPMEQEQPQVRNVTVSEKSPFHAAKPPSDVVGEEGQVSGEGKAPAPSHKDAVRGKEQEKKLPERDQVKAPQKDTEQKLETTAQVSKQEPSGNSTGEHVLSDIAKAVPPTKAEAPRLRKEHPSETPPTVEEGYTKSVKRKMSSLFYSFFGKHTDSETGVAKEPSKPKADETTPEDRSQMNVHPESRGPPSAKSKTASRRGSLKNIPQTAATAPLGGSIPSEYVRSLPPQAEDKSIESLVIDEMEVLTTELSRKLKILKEERKKTKKSQGNTR